MPKKITNNNPFYNHSLALLTDLYQLTMSYGYWKAGMDQKEAVFHLFFRRQTFGGGFTVAAGLESVVDYLNKFRFEPDDLDYLATLRAPDGAPLFDPRFFDYLADMKFTCDIDAIPEGNVVFPFEPLIRVQGPLIQAQLLESPILNLTNFPTLIATKAARICIAANGDEVLEFGLRRAQGIDGSLTASRAAYIGGCAATSNALAGKLYDIPVRGTLAHSWVTAFGDELEAFQAYAEGQPHNCVFLVDTYDTICGVKNAIKVGRWLKEQGKKLFGIRLDSGDLTDLSLKCRELLDEAGFQDVKIMASNELDETIITDLKRQGAKIDVWGVGTNLVTAGNQPALDGVYKLSAIRDPGQPWQYKLKLSEKMAKMSNPGVMQVRRYLHYGEYIADAIYDVHMGIKEDGMMLDPFDPIRQKKLKKEWTSLDLLQPIFKKGKCVYQLPTLKEIRATTLREVKTFPKGIRRFINPQEYPVGMEKSLYDYKVQLIDKIRRGNGD